MIGAGTTGAVVARRLRDRGREVLLLEAGPPADPAPGFDPFAPLRSGTRTWPGLVATHRSGGEPQTYWQGRGVGGTSAVNGMMAVWPRPEDFATWPAEWSWRALEPARRRVEATLVVRPNRRAGVFGPALAEAGATVPGVTVERPPYIVDEHGRVPVATAYGADARTDAEVDRILLDGRRSVGVRLAGGEEIEAGRVVVSAGAIHTPALLLRSGVESDALGANLLDHPAARVRVHLAEPGRMAGRDRLPFSVVLRAGPIQLTPMDYTDDLATAGVTVALMRARSSGTVRVEGGRPVVDLHQLSDGRDRRDLAAGVELAQHLLEQPGVAPFVSAVELPGPDDLGDVFHAAGTCRMGPAGDPGTVVDVDGRVVGYDSLFVADASVMPALPAVNPMLTCVLIGERLVERWAGA